MLVDNLIVVMGGIVIFFSKMGEDYIWVSINVIKDG